MVHAGVCDSRMWGPQWSPFSADRRTVRYDLRGFGDSARPSGPYSHAGDLVALLQELHLERVTLVGASVGGRVAMEVAVAHPELVDALVVVSAPLPGHEWSDQIRAFAAAEEQSLDGGDLEAAVEANLRMWVDGPRPAGAVDPAIRRLVGRMQRRALELQVPAGRSAPERLLMADVAGRLGQIAAPTLVLVGEHDVPDFQEIAARIAGEVPGARKLTIPGAAHLPSLERPAEFNREVLGFLARAVPDVPGRHS
jgi:3-oxoadipate enol-lactonase